jgi:hypothetical protein
LRSADRKSLLLGTALASTLLLGTLVAPAPAHALSCPQPPGGPINVASATDSIECVNVFDIPTAPTIAIDLATSGDNHFITLGNSGNLGAGDYGIRTFTSAQAAISTSSTAATSWSAAFSTTSAFGRGLPTTTARS